MAFAESGQADLSRTSGNLTLAVRRTSIYSALPFVAALLFMLSALLFEALSVRFVTAVLGLDWHRNTAPLPDTGQWFLLAMNEKLPHTMVEILRAHVIGLHHFLMLFIMLAFSVLFDSVKAPSLGLGARYIFTMAIGRLLRAITFVSTILPSARPWCASAQKYYVPYASDANAIRQLIHLERAFDEVANFIEDPRPDWGSMNFLIDFLRPNAFEGSSWYHLLKKAGGGCNDLLYSGHMLVAVLPAMAWTEVYGGFSSVLIWLLVMHSAQREVRARHHYSVDCVVAITGQVPRRIPFSPPDPTSFYCDDESTDSPPRHHLHPHGLVPTFSSICSLSSTFFSFLFFFLYHPLPLFLITHETTHMHHPLSLKIIYHFSHPKPHHNIFYLYFNMYIYTYI
ncbi:uncharacterized protein LOC114283206 [Camellia sinensis]|uniref:uncharacterized protein LOC114283206 n=1 Tax=Camellia sinensis TaxID=4442 RepID=UPI0010358D25|nr:uncharacterized protein LOC114283206 [Camellia sinensis]